MQSAGSVGSLSQPAPRSGSMEVTWGIISSSTFMDRKVQAATIQNISVNISSAFFFIYFTSANTMPSTSSRLK